MDLVTREAEPGVRPLRVSYHAFLGTIWAGVAISGLALAGRIYSRFRGARRLFWDDACAIFAFTMILITGALWQSRAKDMYYSINAQSGIEPYEADYLTRMRRFLVTSLLAYLFFYTSLLSIKLSFLFFFWRLGSHARYFKYLWWPVTLLAISSYFISIGIINYTCLTGSIDTLIKECTSSRMINLGDISLRVSCALDVFTDLLIMVLPTTLLWNVHIRPVRKIAILGLFSLSIVTIAIAIVRVATITLTKMPDGNEDVSYLGLWSATEPAVALVVSCISVFPQLFVQSSRNKKRPFTPSTYLRNISHIHSRKRDRNHPWDGLTDISQTQDFDGTRLAPDTETSSRRSQESRELDLIPQNPRPVAYAYTGQPNDSILVPKNRIMQQFEFHVTEQ